MIDSDRPQPTVLGDASGAELPGESHPASPVPSRLPAAAAPEIVEKVILLVDVNPVTRDSRARVMERRGIAVHTVGSSGEAILRFSSGSYDLVLIDLGRNRERAERLAEELRLNRPRQRVAFLVGGPQYVVASPVKKQRPNAAAKRKDASGVAPFDFGQRVRETETGKA